MKKWLTLPDFWTDFSKGSLSPVGEGMLEQNMTLCLVVQSNKCGDMWQQLFWGAVISLQLKLLESTALTTV